MEENSERCPGAAGSEGELEEKLELASRLHRIRHKVIVLSGKGGVGKSTVAVNLAVALSRAGKRVGLLDVDIHGPSVPGMLGLTGASLQAGPGGMLPVETEGIRVMSIAFLLSDADSAVIWRGPMKMAVIKQFLKDVEWGDLDFLVIDAPPGTGDEPLSVCQLIGNVDGAVVVTTPQEVALAAVRKSVTFCRALGLPVLGVVENMGGFVCPHCGGVSEVFGSGGGEKMAERMGVHFLGRIPMDPGIALGGDSGKPSLTAGFASPAAEAFGRIVRPILELDGRGEAGTGGPAPENVDAVGRAHVKTEEGGRTPARKENTMRIAIPIAEGRLALHFGHCERFALIDVDEAGKTVTSREEIAAPEHEPGLLPRWLAERNVKTVIAGGMGSRAQGLFKESGITVVTGASAETPDKLVNDYLAGTLTTGSNVCDH
jgi:ATP-binding protein involved in chromosome partitioning